MRKQWVLFILTAIGAVVVGLWIYRKINPGPGITSIASGGAGSQAATEQGYKLETPLSSISVGPSTVTPKSDWDYVDYVNNLPR